MNVMNLSATDFPIKSVKIFNSNVAEVTRVFPLDFTQSPNESQVIEISNLPKLYCSGIRASVTTGSDDLLVMDYYHSSSEYRHTLFGHRRDDDTISSDVLRDLKAEFTRLEDERLLRQQSFAFLSTYMNSLAKGDAPVVAEPAQLVKFFDEFVDIGKSRSEVIAVLDQQIKDVQKEIDKEIQRLYLESLSLATKVTVILAPVSGRTATIAELELKYRVNATWEPVYEIHVTTIDNVPSSSVALTYRCQIAQSTGENWDNVELVVTTASPHVPSVGLPEPKKIEIRQQGFLLQPDSYHQPAVRPQVTPFWNTPGYASPFGNILSSTQQTRQSVFGSTQSALHQADPSRGSAGVAQGHAADNVRAFQEQPTTITQGSFGSTSAQPTISRLFGTLQGQPTTTTQGLFGSTPAQSSAGRTFGASQSSTQPQASFSTIIPPPPYSSTRNSSVSSFGRSTATENTLSFNQPTLNLQESQPLPSSASAQRQRDRAVLAELDKDVTHTATAKVFIPSRASGGTHHVLIATVPLKASFTRVAVPSVDTRVFFTCEISNTSNYVLTPGTVHTYLDGRHVSDSDITSVNQPQTIQCSLGIDPAVTTQFNRTVDSLPDFTVLNGKAITTHTITTTIKNTHLGPVSNVIVRTSLPLPADPRVTVALQEPEGLADIDSGTVRVGDEFYARWSTTGDRAGENDGLFEWVCGSVKPGSQVLKAVWYVTAPRGLSFTEQ
ncbi:hypothetical protein EDB19DRAFT_1721791 [Suillus lakei]|nr:hypothetical protein EDB19DRAFT_1721791 [Suillus lakei]